MAAGKGMSEPGNEVQKWADSAMFRSESHDASTGPRVHLLHMTADPLAAIAACAKMYKGEVVRSFADVTHAERREYLAEMQKTKLKMPLEAVHLHFQIENVTRAFTHQLVRQRTAAYAQESMRFAVVEDMTEAVALPPSLAGTLSTSEWHAEHGLPPEEGVPVTTYGEYHRSSQRQKWRLRWEAAVGTISETYNFLVEDGMPAEDARGLMPTNIVTRVNYITNLRGLLDHAGNRLCTQAQFEWRLVFAQISQAIRNYGQHDARIESWSRNQGAHDDTLAAGLEWLDSGDEWQYEAIADLLQPVCYQIGKCAFEASFDRKCSIRDRVQANAEIGRKPEHWGEDLPEDGNKTTPYTMGSISAIHPREWLADPGAAR